MPFVVIVTLIEFKCPIKKIETTHGSIVSHFGDQFRLYSYLFSVYFKTISSFPTIFRKENISEFPERKNKDRVCFQKLQNETFVNQNVVGAERRSNFKKLRHFVIKTTNGQTFGNDSGSLMSFQVIARVAALVFNFSFR